MEKTIQRNDIGFPGRKENIDDLYAYNNERPPHESVLLDEAISALDVRLNDTVVDATIGGAGHFSGLLSKLGEGGTIVGIDSDSEAAERGREAYARDRRANRPIAHIINDNFRNLSRVLERLNIGSVDKVLFDLGWSGYQLGEPRGFSFAHDEPLLMTYDVHARAGETAADIVNTMSERELADLIFQNGDERFARGIARSVVKMRAKERILTTSRLVDAVLSGTPVWYHKRRIHPATKTFQALRIAVNDEIGSLKEGLASALDALSGNGRIAVITFHSTEDRIVKQMFGEAAKTGRGSLKPVKPITPSRSEIARNRRSRSAKLRVFHASHV